MCLTSFNELLWVTGLPPFLSFCTCLSRFTFWGSHDSICTFHIPSLPIAGACSILLETELARRTTRRAQVKQLKSEKLSPCSRGNLEDLNACASTTLSWPLSTRKVLFLETPKNSIVLILFHFVLRQSKTRLISRYFPKSYSRVKLIDR